MHATQHNNKKMDPGRVQPHHLPISPNRNKRGEATTRAHRIVYSSSKENNNNKIRNGTPKGASHLRLAQRVGVVGDEDELGTALAERLQGRPVAERVLAALHHDLEVGVDRLSLLLLARRHLWMIFFS